MRSPVSKKLVHSNIPISVVNSSFQIITRSDELVGIDLWVNVTVVVASEMGRTITPNTSDGTDHGWAGHHFVVGGNVRMPCMNI